MPCAVVFERNKVRENTESFRLVSISSAMFHSSRAISNCTDFITKPADANTTESTLCAREFVSISTVCRYAVLPLHLKAVDPRAKLDVSLQSRSSEHCTGTLVVLVVVVLEALLAPGASIQTFRVCKTK